MYKAYTRRRATKSGEAKGAVAQLGERLLCKQEVIGSIPFSSTKTQAVEATIAIHQRAEASGKAYF